MEKLDKIAAEYHASDAIPDIHIENLCQEYFSAWLLKHIDTGARVLELGYGDGLVTDALARSGCDLTVIEGSSVLADAARRKHPTVICELTLFEDFRTDRPFDLIIASHVLEHVEEPVAILKNIFSWLRDDGKLIVVVPNRNSIHRQLAVAMGLQPRLDSLSNRDSMVGHQRVYSFLTLESDLNSAGMRAVDSTGYFLKVLPNSMMLDYSTDLLKSLNEISPSLPRDILANIVVVAEKNAA
jgi:2-polyprenyl-3-methyl-5-hydroxy-6-metoxy-1,4-benzoquinol methylase